MAHSPDDIELLMSSYMASRPWDLDPNVLPIPWRTRNEVMPSGPLCFAVAYGDESVGFLVVIGRFHPESRHRG